MSKRIDPEWLLWPAAAAFLLFIYICGYRLGFGVDSDEAFYLRAAEEMMNGNFLLKGWYGGFYNNFTSDFLWVFLMRHFWSREVIEYTMGPIAYTLTVLMAVLLVRKGAASGKRFVLLCLLPVIFLPGELLRYGMLSVGIHAITIFYLFLLYVVFDHLIQKNPAWWEYLLYFLLVVFCSLNDEWPMYFFALPIVLVLSIDLFQNFDKTKCTFLVTTILAILTEKGILKLMAAAGGIRCQEVSMKFIDFKELPDYFTNFLLTFLSLFNANVSGKDLFSASTLECAVGLALAVEIIYTMIVCVKNWRTSAVSSKAMCFGALLCLGTFLFDALNKGTWWPAPARYMAPFFYLGMLVLCRWKNDAVFRKRRYEVLFFLPIVLFGLLNAPWDFHRKPVDNQRLEAISDYLIEQGVTRAYATYWESHSVWYYSNGQVETASIFENTGKIRPYYWVTNPEWFEPEFNANCLIVTEGQGPNEEEVIAAFGEPVSHEMIDTAHIYIFDHNISESVYANRQE